MENYISNIFTLANFEWSPVNKFIIYNLIIGFNSMDYPPLPSPGLGRSPPSLHHAHLRGGAAQQI